MKNKNKIKLLYLISKTKTFPPPPPLFFFCNYDFPKRCWVCDASKPGGPLTTRQPAEFYVSHVMKPIHVQKWPLGPTHHTHKMYILYKKRVYLQLYLITIYTKLGLLPEFYKIQDKASLTISSPLRPRMRPIPKCVFGT